MQSVAVKSWKIRRKEQLRDEMISAARELFNGKGFEATSVDEIVARTGVAKGTFYLYFKTKADIAQTIVEEDIEELETCISAAIASAPGNASEELRAVMESQLNFLVKHRPMVSILLTDGSPANFYLTEDLTQRCASACANIYERIIRKGMLQGLYREVDAPVAAMMLRGMVAGALQSTDDFSKDTADLCKACVDFFEKGIGRVV